MDIIGSTQRFKSYPAYDLLKDEFIAMGVSVSDYALVMDEYEFSMKDLLEIGPGESYWIKPSVLEDLFAKRGTASLIPSRPSSRRARSSSGSCPRALPRRGRGAAVEGRHRAAARQDTSPEAHDVRRPYPDRPAVPA